MPVDTFALARTFDLLAGPTGVHWTAMSPTRRAAVGGQARDPDELAKRASQQDGWDFYVCLNPSDVERTKPAKADIQALSCIGIDVDPPQGGQLDLAAVSELLTRTLTGLFGRPNTHCVISSGRGCWAWLFIEPQPILSPEQRAEADGLFRAFTALVVDKAPALAQLGFVDPASAELSRVARCPGTINTRSAETAAIIVDYFPIEPVRYQEVLELSQPFLDALERRSIPQPISAYGLSEIAPALNVAGRAFAMSGADGSIESRHRAAFKAAKSLHEIGVPADVAEWVLWSGASKCRPDLNKTDPGFIARLVRQLWRVQP